ncbi:MAG: cytochrome c biogenesis factor [Leptolyngbya foveolarum]|uniref:Cytochrome c biogenesis factor n=1 Tax=Leptolyngbya foveolarum TaxID=47253 RepID=A0A2W4US47_9CYAN|nr:MAG: cytochrome c biogenesis factor [Leptolyngbya foveolarum]
MLKRITVSLLLLIGAWSQAKPAAAQALLPYTLPLDQTRLQADGESLAQDAVQLAQFQQYDEALARAQLAAQLLPGNADVLALLGSLYLQSSKPQPEQAIATLEQAKELQPDNALVMFALGSAYFSHQDYSKAVKSIESGLKIEPENPNALFDLGNAYYKLSQFDRAIAQYEKAVAKESSFWPAVNNIGLVKYESGDTAGAIAEWQRALDLAGEEQTEPQLAIAVAQFSQGQTASSSDAAIVALERDPSYADIDFLKDNLWGEKLITATKQFFSTPELQELLVQLTPKEVEQPSL